MKSNQHSLRQILFFALFACVAFFYWFQGRWGVPFFFPKPAFEAVVKVTPQEPVPPDREAPSQIAVPHRTEVESFKYVNQDSLKLWEQKVFKGVTQYTILSEDGLTYLSSKSSNSSSGLFIKTKHKATPDMWIEWRWRAVTFPDKKHPEKLSNRSEDDFSARVYVIFAASNIFRSDVIEYVWDKTLPPGSHSESAYSDRIHLMVIRSGVAPTEANGWVKEERNIYNDYRALFGKEPKYNIGMVAVMSDSDNTGTAASADFADIVLSST